MRFLAEFLSQVLQEVVVADQVRDLAQNLRHGGFDLGTEIPHHRPRLAERLHATSQQAGDLLAVFATPSSVPAKLQPRWPARALNTVSAPVCTCRPRAARNLRPPPAAFVLAGIGPGARRPDNPGRCGPIR